MKPNYKGKKNLQKAFYKYCIFGNCFMTKIEENKKFEIDLRSKNVLTEYMTFGHKCFQ